MARTAEETEPGTHLDRRSARKQRAILDAARGVFLAKGYPGASMDEVAARADVSKVTVYKHFSDKHSLFTAVVTGAIDEAEESGRSLVDHLADSVDVEKDLRAFAREHITTVTQPHLIQMRRMIIAEANRFPDLARTWHRVGPERGHASLAAQIEKLARTRPPAGARPAARRAAPELPDPVRARERGHVHGARQAVQPPVPTALRGRGRSCLHGRLRRRWRLAGAVDRGSLTDDSRGPAGTSLRSRGSPSPPRVRGTAAAAASCRVRPVRRPRATPRGSRGGRSPRAPCPAGGRSCLATRRRRTR